MSCPLWTLTKYAPHRLRSHVLIKLIKININKCRNQKSCSQRPAFKLQLFFSQFKCQMSYKQTRIYPNTNPECIYTSALLSRSKPTNKQSRARHESDLSKLDQPQESHSIMNTPSRSIYHHYILSHQSAFSFVHRSTGGTGSQHDIKVHQFNPVTSKQGNQLDETYS